MKFTGVKIKSKNIRMFLYTISIIIVLMLVFFIVVSEPITPKIYISFGFLWLSAILSVCIVYLIPTNKARIKSGILLSVGFYLALTLVLNTFFINSLELLTIVVVDFFLVFAILTIGIILNYLNKSNDA